MQADAITRAVNPSLEVHASLLDPTMDAINFLNEVMKTYPDAISFAPGAPNPDLYDVDIAGSIDLYLDHVGRRDGIDRFAAERTLYEYGPARGIITEIIAEALARDRIAELKSEHIVVTVGAQEGIFLSLRALFRSADDVLAVTNPAYVGVIGAARLLGVEMVPVSDSGAGPDLDELEDAISLLPPGKRLRAIYVAPDYSNPSGSLMDSQARRRLVALAEFHDFYILEDTVYGFTAPDEAHPASLKSLDRQGRVVMVGTFAKIALPGARVGYVATDRQFEDVQGCPRGLADLIAAAKTMVTVNTSPISQAVVAGMLLKEGTSITRMSERHRALYRSNLEQLLDCLDRHLGPCRSGSPGLDWSRPTGGFFVRVTLPVPADNRLLDYSAREFGVLWTPMAPFYVDAKGECELRLSCSYLTHAQIDEGIRRFAEFARSVAL